MELDHTICYRAVEFGDEFLDILKHKVYRLDPLDTFAPPVKHAFPTASQATQFGSDLISAGIDDIYLTAGRIDYTALNHTVFKSYLPQGGRMQMKLTLKALEGTSDVKVLHQIKLCE